MQQPVPDYTMLLEEVRIAGGPSVRGPGRRIAFCGRRRGVLSYCGTFVLTTCTPVSFVWGNGAGVDGYSISALPLPGSGCLSVRISCVTVLGALPGENRRSM